LPVFHKQFTIQSCEGPTFHDVSAEIERAVAESNIDNGIACVFSQHTTCSVIIQEEAHDMTYAGTKYLHQDLVNVLERIIPQCRHERQYLHPGPIHIKHATENLGEEAGWSLNTDAHLRSCLMGRSETIPIIDKRLELGEFGRIYFVDFDTVRQRRRTVHVQLVGE
jgi:thiamine phosphate synthase YjbQ (UPF0047 family)